MRKPIIAGNWKMFKTRDEALAFIYAVNNDMPSIDKVDTVICAPFVVLLQLVFHMLSLDILKDVLCLMKQMNQ